MNRLTTPDGTPIQAPPPVPPREKLLWRVLITDNLAMPHQRATAVLSGHSNMLEALDAAKECDTFTTFKSMFPHAVIAAIEFFGFTE